MRKARSFDPERSTDDEEFLEAYRYYVEETTSAVRTQGGKQYDWTRALNAVRFIFSALNVRHRSLRQVAFSERSPNGKVYALTVRLMRTLYILMVSADSKTNAINETRDGTITRTRIMASILMRELSNGTLPMSFQANFRGRLKSYETKIRKAFVTVCLEISSAEFLKRNVDELLFPEMEQESILKRQQDSTETTDCTVESSSALKRDRHSAHPDEGRSDRFLRQTKRDERLLHPRLLSMDILPATLRAARLGLMGVAARRRIYRRFAAVLKGAELKIASAIVVDTAKVPVDRQNADGDPKNARTIAVTPQRQRDDADDSLAGSVDDIRSVGKSKNVAPATLPSLSQRNSAAREKRSDGVRDPQRSITNATVSSARNAVEHASSYIEDLSSPLMRSVTWIRHRLGGREGSSGRRAHRRGSVVMELDMSPAREMFTVLNRVDLSTTRSFTATQQLSVRVFSMAYAWLRTFEVKIAESQISVVDANADVACAETSSDVFRGESEARDKIFRAPSDFERSLHRYCLRILEQAAMRRVEGLALRTLVQKATPEALGLVRQWEAELVDAATFDAMRVIDYTCLHGRRCLGVTDSQLGNEKDTARLPKTPTRRRAAPENDAYGERGALVSRFFPVVKRFALDEFDRHIERTTSRHRTIPLLVVLQFLLNHGDVVVYDVEPVLDWFFATHLFGRSNLFRNSLLAYETMMFCERNKRALLTRTPVFEHFWPCLIKLVAWHPLTLDKLFGELLPACLSESTCIAVLDAILDLPLLAAVLEGQMVKQYPEKKTRRPDALSTPLERRRHREMNIEMRVLKDLTRGRFVANDGMSRTSSDGTPNEAQRDRSTRNSSSTATPLSGLPLPFTSRVSALRRISRRMRLSRRVSAACDVVPSLVQTYFGVLLSDAPQRCTLVSIRHLLRRFEEVFGPTFFRRTVQQTMVHSLLAALEKDPAWLLVSLKREVTDAIVTYSSGPRTRGHRELVTHLCWAIGAYAAQVAKLGHDGVGRHKHLRDFYQPLELLVYERISVARWLTATAADMSKATSKSRGRRGRGDDRTTAAKGRGSRLSNDEEETPPTVVRASTRSVSGISRSAPASTPSGRGTKSVARAAEGRSHMRDSQRLQTEDVHARVVRARFEKKRIEVLLDSRLLAVTISALTKLASHQTDLTPRVLISFAKMLAPDTRPFLHDDVVHRAQESTLLLQYPSTVSVLSQVSGDRISESGVLISRLQSGRTRAGTFDFAAHI